MYADPQTLTVNAVAKTLKRLGTSLNASRYAEADRTRVLSISHTEGRRNQDRVRLDHSKIIVDPLASDRNIPVSMSVYLVIDRPTAGYTVADVKNEVIALADWLKASTNTDSLVGGEV